MKLFLIVYLFTLSLNVFAQKSEEVSATANGQTYTAQNLAPEFSRNWRIFRRL